MDVRLERVEDVFTRLSEVAKDAPQRQALAVQIM
jgi:hypothetical protein